MQEKLEKFFEMCVTCFPSSWEQKHCVKKGLCKFEAENLWPYQDTVPAQENCEKQVRETGKKLWGLYKSRQVYQQNVLCFFFACSFVKKKLFMEESNKIIIPSHARKKFLHHSFVNIYIFCILSFMLLPYFGSMTTFSRREHWSKQIFNLFNFSSVFSGWQVLVSRIN